MISIENGSVFLVMSLTYHRRKFSFAGEVSEIESCLGAIGKIKLREISFKTNGRKQNFNNYCCGKMFVHEIY
jgi:hypothetical protein